MMDIYMMQYNHRFRHLVVINENTYVSVYKNEKFKFDQPFLSFQAKIFLLVNRGFVKSQNFRELWITLTSMVILFY